MSTYTQICAPGLFALTFAPSTSNFQMDADPGLFVETGQAITQAVGLFVPLWDFSNPQMTFDDPRWTFDGLFLTDPVTPPVVPPVGPTPPPTPNLRVMAVSAGTYNGNYYEPGDVFDLLQILDYSDSTKNVQPQGAEFAPGWMLSVPPGTPLYQTVSQQLYPTSPAVDPARRFVL